MDSSSLGRLESALQACLDAARHCEGLDPRGASTVRYVQALINSACDELDELAAASPACARSAPGRLTVQGLRESARPTEDGGEHALP